MACRISVAVTSEALAVEPVMALVGDPAAGAVSVFVGTTRNTFGGRVVVRLEYEGYVAMAERQMRRLCEDAAARWPSLIATAVHHRLGHVPIGEASVVVAASSPHRRDALDAVAHMIDVLKATVPIWKKEVYADGGASWKENCECAWAGKQALQGGPHPAHDRDGHTHGHGHTHAQ